MNNMEKRISFLNNYFVYKKVRHDTVPVKLRGEYDDLHTDISVKQIYDDDENENNNDKTKMKIKKTTKKAVIKKN